jgi:hypothetical protein
MKKGYCVVALVSVIIMINYLTAFAPLRTISVNSTNGNLIIRSFNSQGN